MVMLVSCSQSAPSCSSDDAKQLVLDIVKDSPFVIGFKMTMTELDLSLGTIRTLRHDESTGRYHCAANLQFNGISAISKEPVNKSLPIEYTSELTDAGEFYITVEGI
jgi:hypothetical protein